MSARRVGRELVDHGRIQSGNLEGKTIAFWILVPVGLALAQWAIFGKIIPEIIKWSGITTNSAPGADPTLSWVLGGIWLVSALIVYFVSGLFIDSGLGRVVLAISGAATIMIALF